MNIFCFLMTQLLNRLVRDRSVRIKSPDSQRSEPSLLRHSKQFGLLLGFPFLYIFDIQNHLNHDLTLRPDFSQPPRIVTLRFFCQKLENFNDAFGNNNYESYGMSLWGFQPADETYWLRLPFPFTKMLF